MALATHDDIADLCEVDQLCSGLKGGIDGAVHTMRELFEEHQADGWGLLLMDASNAYNSLNRAAAIWNSQHSVASMFPILIYNNTYRGYASLCYKKKGRLNFYPANKVLLTVIFCQC